MSLDPWERARANATKQSTCVVCGLAISFGVVGYGRAHWYHDENLFVSCQTLVGPTVPRGSKATPTEVSA